MEENWLHLHPMLLLILCASHLQPHVGQSDIGVISSQSRLVTWGRPHVHPLQWNLDLHWNAWREDPNISVPVFPAAQSAAPWWRELDHCVSVPVTSPTAPVRLFTDACTVGWGAHLEELTCKGTWSPAESKLHINILEMRAVRLVLLNFNLHSHSAVLVSTDSTIVVSYINKEGGTWSASLWTETQELFQVVLSRQWTPQGGTHTGTWSLHLTVVRALFDLWGCPHVDLFDTRLNCKLDIFVSPMPDPQVWVVDALFLSLAGLWAYPFPPHQIMAKVLHHLQKFQQPTGTRFHLDPPMLQLHAWGLSSRGSAMPASPRTQTAALPLPSLPPLLHL